MFRKLFGKSFERVLSGWFVLLLLPIPLHADEGGIRFESMPVGCLSHFIYVFKGDGYGEVEGEAINVYAGLVGGSHAIRSYSRPSRTGTFGPKDLVFTSYYNAKGLLVRRETTDGEVVKFRPHGCRAATGRCAYSAVSNRRGTFQFEAETTRRGGKVYFSSVFESGSRLADFSVEIGRFNEFASGPWGSGQRTTAKYEGCGF